MTPKRFKQIWDCHMGGPKRKTTSVDHGSSKKLRDAIEKASKEGRSLALTDWRKVASANGEMWHE